jgi:hypothetical protein
MSEDIAPRESIDPISTAYGNIISMLLGIFKIIYLMTTSM